MAGRQFEWRSILSLQSQDFEELTTFDGEVEAMSLANSPIARSCLVLDQGSFRSFGSISSFSGRYIKDGKWLRLPISPGEISWGMAKCWGRGFSCSVST